MGLVKRTYVDGETVITADNLNDIQDEIIQNEEDITTKGTYSKPTGGIPKTDLASAVQTSLEKADTALQSSDIDSTLTVSGKAADAKKTGDEISGVKNTLNQLDEGLAIPQTGNTCSRESGIPVGAFIFLQGNSTLADGIYQNTSGSIIAKSATFTTSNLTRCYQETGALNTINTQMVNYLIAQVISSNRFLNTPLRTEADFVQYFSSLYNRNGLFHFSWIDSTKSSTFASAVNATNGFGFVLNNEAWVNHPLVFAFTADATICSTWAILTASGYTMATVRKINLT